MEVIDDDSMHAILKQHALRNTIRRRKLGLGLPKPSSLTTRHATKYDDFRAAADGLDGVIASTLTPKHPAREIPLRSGPQYSHLKLALATA
ncbi:hypothetical protein [Thermopirellula anaerolimosa]